MDLFVIIMVLLSVLLIICLSIETEFDKEIKDIENILSLKDASKQKYKLFDRLEKLADKCNNYSQLSKLQDLTLKVYSL